MVELTGEHCTASPPMGSLVGWFSLLTPGAGPFSFDTFAFVIYLPQEVMPKVRPHPVS